MRQALALLMTTWAGVVIAALCWFLEIIFVSFTLSSLGITAFTNPWVWWIVLIGNAFVVNYFFWTWPQRLRAEGKAFLAAKEREQLDAESHEKVD